VKAFAVDIAVRVQISEQSRAALEGERDVGHDILLKEFVLDIDEEIGSSVVRNTYTARLMRDPKPLHDVNEWQTAFSGGAIGFHNASTERSARDRFVKEVLRLRVLEAEAKKAGRYASSCFTSGSWSEDAI
jgi:hypothetical protein